MICVLLCCYTVQTEVGATLYIIQQIYVSVYALGGRISHTESSVNGHESLN